MDRCRISLSLLDSYNKLEWTKYQCPQCKWLLQDAVQTSCGHWLCLECAQELFIQRTPHCPKDGCAEQLTEEDGTPFFPDRFVRKEIAKFLVRCVNHEKGCGWRGLVSKLQRHLESCEHSRVQCEHCRNWIPPAEQNVHFESCPMVQVPCPFADVGCKQTDKMTRPQLMEHLTRESGLPQHLHIIANCLRTSSSPTHNGSNIDERDCVTHACKSEPLLVSQVRSAINSTRQRVFADGIMSMQNRSGRVRDELETIAAARNAWLPDMMKFASAHKEEIELLRSKLVQKDDAIASLQGRVQQLERAQQSKSSENEDRDFRLSLIENSNFDGTMIWKVPQFSQRMEDARTGKYTSIFSLPFYSARYGYKMCLRLYILGDGIGKGTHMSLFFVLMKGEFDNILQWPFTFKVTFKLLNQSGGRDITDLFQPDPLSSSFQKPKGDMNVASGCPRFISLQELMSGGFIMDDTVFIKARVDTSNMRHP